MNDRREHGGHSVLPLLLIPATVMMVKAMHRHQAMRAHGWGSGGYGPGFGHRGWAAGPAGTGEAGAEERSDFRLPPRIQAYLTAWHEQAHRESDAGEAPSA